MNAETDQVGWLARRRLRRAVDKRDDLRAHASDFGWAWLPSRHRAAARAYDKADARVVGLGGQSLPWPRGNER